jgi:predicted nucleic acid-binding protein
MSLFVDTSALMAFYAQESSSDLIEHYILSADRLVISELSRVEMASALARRVRMNELLDSSRDEIWGLFQEDLLAVNVRVALMNSAIFLQAVELINKYGDIHSLRSLDSLQLASALYSNSQKFLSLDQTLNTIATKVGLKVL